MPPPVQPDGLESWKEIAAYLSRGVRTVRRWEREEGLPVHRHVHRKLGTVYAYKSEIDAWRRTRGSQSHASVADAAAASQVKSIAVLPFENLSTDPDNEYFASGLTDEITADLSKIRSLRVTSRTSAMTFRGSLKDVKKIAAELEVRYVLEGSVRWAGNRLRITAQLIDAASDDHLWADTFEGTVDDVFAMQQRLAALIVDALKLRLTADEERRLVERTIDNVHAYECYLRARHEGWRWRKDSIDRAVRLLRDGLEIVGDNVRLHTALGLAYLQYREAGIDLSDRPLVEAEACAAKAAALEPGSAPTRQLRGWIHYSRGHIQDAVRDLKEALALDPNNADTLLLLSNCYLISGKVSLARPLLARLTSVDPLMPLARCLPGYADLLEGNFAAAADPYRQMFEMDPSNPMARLFYAWVLLLNHRHGEAEAVARSSSPEVHGSVPARVALFLSHASAGEREHAVTLVTQDIEAVATATDVFPRFLAHGYAIAGFPERAIDWLTIAVDRGFINYPFLSRYDPCFEILKHRPRFHDLLDIVRERWQRFEG